METSGCIFPEGLFYAGDMYMWFRKDGEDVYTAGVTSALLWTAGKPFRLELRKPGTGVAAGKSIGSIESGKLFEMLRVPFECVLTSINREVGGGSGLTPATAYSGNWLASLSAEDELVAASTLSGEDAMRRAREKVAELRLNCFSQLPDAEMVEIGSECSAVLARLSGAMEKRPRGYVVHLVTDDITAPMELVRWADETKNSLLETRKVGNVYHFLAVKE